MRNDSRKRKSLAYKVRFWFYRLTIEDVKKGVKGTLNLIVELVMCALIFILLFLIPAFLH